MKLHLVALLSLALLAPVAHAKDGDDATKSGRRSSRVAKAKARKGKRLSNHRSGGAAGAGSDVGIGSFATGKSDNFSPKTNPYADAYGAPH